VSVRTSSWVLGGGAHSCKTIAAVRADDENLVTRFPPARGGVDGHGGAARERRIRDGHEGCDPCAVEADDAVEDDTATDVEAVFFRIDGGTVDDLDVRRDVCIDGRFLRTSDEVRVRRADDRVDPHLGRLVARELEVSGDLQAMKSVIGLEVVAHRARRFVLE